MSKIVLFLLSGLLLFSHTVPAFADGYDDCLDGCRQTVAPCVEQVRLNAGNIKEEEDGIAACEKSKADCIQACKDAEAQPQSPPPAQEQPPQEQPPQDSTGVGTGNGIKTYEIKTYEFK
jgi:hypothetical protein